MPSSISRRDLLALAPLAVCAAACSKLDDQPDTPRFSNGVGLLMHGENRVDVPRAPSADPAGSGASTVTLAAKLAGAIDHRSSLLLSPASLSMPLAITANGARGRTQSELLELLGAKNLDELNKQHNAVNQALSSYSKKVTSGDRKGESRVQMANAMFAQQDKPVTESFLRDCAQWYGTGLHGVDFAKADEAAKLINQWGAEHTNDRIRAVVDPNSFSQRTRLVIANALWFKSPWAKPLEPAAGMKFTRSNGETVTAQQYTSHASLWADADGWQLAVTSYLDSRFTMVFALPDKVSDEQAMVSSWAKGSLARTLDALDTASIELRMPIWKFEQGHDLVEPLKKLGVSHLFMGQPVDLSGISSTEQLEVSAIVQKTWIDVDEEGTEAAAVSAATFGATASAPPDVPPKQIVLDRPFWYFLQDSTTGTILFMGRMDDPRTE